MRKIEKTVMKLGVTGGIGSGKTSVCRVFKVLGIPVFSTDHEAKEIMNHDADVIKSIRKIAGENLYNDGILDRKKLADLIFIDPLLLRKINAVVHPAVFNNFNRWVEKQNTPYVIMESAILFESGAFELVDRVVTVVAPVEERIERVMRRNKLTEKQVIDRVNNQLDDDSKINKSDYIINNSEKDMIIPVILDIHKDILNHLNS